MKLVSSLRIEGNLSVGTTSATVTSAGNATFQSVSATSISGVNLFDTNFSGSKSLVSNADNSIGEALTTTTQINYLSGVTSDVQSQLDSKITELYGSTKFLPLSGGTVSGLVTLSGAYDNQLTIGKNGAGGKINFARGSGGQLTGAIGFMNSNDAASFGIFSTGGGGGFKISTNGYNTVWSTAGELSLPSTLSVNSPDKVLQTITSSTINVTPTHLLSKPYNYGYHDWSAFSAPYLYETTSDKTTWTSAAVNTKLFDANPSTSVTTVASATSTSGVRWTWNTVQWSQVDTLIITPYYCVPPACTFLIEVAVSGTTDWVISNSATITPSNTNPVYISFPDVGGNPYLRVSIIANGVGDSYNITSLQLWTMRNGVQGKNKNNAIPFSWDYNKNITMTGNLTGTNATFSGQITASFMWGKSQYISISQNSSSNADYNIPYIGTVSTGDLFYSSANGITINPSSGVIKAKSITENGTSLISKYLTLSGGTMSGTITTNANYALRFGYGSTTNYYMASDTNGIYLAVFGSANSGKRIYLESYDTDIHHRKNGINYAMLDQSNFGTIIGNASSSTNGLLTSSDWTTFDNKLSTSTAASTYLTISTAASTYLPLSGGNMTGPIGLPSAVMTSSTSLVSQGINFSSYHGITQFNGSYASQITGGVGAADGLFIYGYTGVALGWTAGNGTSAGVLSAALRTNGANVNIAGLLTVPTINVTSITASNNINAGTLNIGSGESKFWLGTYVDPHVGGGYAIKVGASGIAVNGNSLFNATVSAVNFIDTGFAGNKVLISNADKSIGESVTSTVQIEYLSAVTSDVQTQINNKMNTNGSNASTSVKIAAAVESNAITTVQYAGSTITANAPQAGAALRSAIKFDWYATTWDIGNIRGSSTDTAGFGIATSAGTNLRWRVTNGTTYDYNNLIVTGTISTTAALSAGTIYEGGTSLASKYLGSTSIATGSYFLNENSTFKYSGEAGLQYYDGDFTSVGTSANYNGFQGPTSAWYQVIHMPLSVANYYNELLFPVNDTAGLWWRQRRNSAYYGWFKILDSQNFNTYALPLTGGTLTGPVSGTSISASNFYGTFNGSIGSAPYLPLSGGTMDSGATITLQGTTPAFNLPTGAFGASTGVGTWFANTSAGDVSIRTSVGTNAVHIGAGSGNSTVKITSAGLIVVQGGINLYPSGGAVTFANGTWNTVGDDIQFGDINEGGTLGLRRSSGDTTCYIRFGATGASAGGTKVGWNGASFQIGSNTNIAGSLSATGTIYEGGSSLASKYVPYSIENTGSGNFNFDTWKSSINFIGSIYYSTYTTAPPSWSHGSLIQGFGANANWNTQLAIGTGSEGMYFRRSTDPGAVWGPWRTVWHDGNLTTTSIANWNTAYANNHTHSGTTGKVAKFTSSNTIGDSKIDDGNAQYTLINGYNYFYSNIDSQVIATSNHNGIGWNRSAGNGEMNFINVRNSLAGGFSWYTVSGGVWTREAYLAPGGYLYGLTTVAVTNELTVAGIKANYYSNTVYSGLWGTGVTKNDNNWAFLMRNDNNSQTYLNASSSLELQIFNGTGRNTRLQVVDSGVNITGSIGATNNLTVTGTGYFGSSLTVGQASLDGQQSLFIGNDASLGDCNTAATIRIQGSGSSTSASGYFKFGSTGPVVGYNGSKFSIPAYTDPDSIKLGTGFSKMAGVDMSTFWILVAEMWGTGQGASQKWYVTLYGSDWGDSAGRLEASFSNYNLYSAGTTTLSITESEVYWTHTANELLNQRSWRAVRRNSDDAIRVYVQLGTGADYSTLNATTVYHKDGWVGNSYGDFSTYRTSIITSGDTANFWSGTGYTVLTVSTNRGYARTGVSIVDSIQKSGSSVKDYLRGDGSVYTSENNNGVSRLYRRDGTDTYYIYSSWSTSQWCGNTWRLKSANEQGPPVDSQPGINTTCVTYSDFANVLGTTNTTSTTVRSTWNPLNKTLVWGQSFVNSAISNDSGDITYIIRASEYGAGATEACIVIDGDYYAGTGQYKVYHAGNYDPLSSNNTWTGTNNFVGDVSANYMYPFKIYIKSTGGSYDNGIEWMSGMRMTVPSGSNRLSVFRTSDNSAGKISFGINDYNYVEATGTGVMNIRATQGSISVSAYSTLSLGSYAAPVYINAKSGIFATSTSGPIQLNAGTSTFNVTATGGASIDNGAYSFNLTASYMNITAAVGCTSVNTGSMTATNVWGDTSNITNYKQDGYSYSTTLGINRVMNQPGPGYVGIGGNSTVNGSKNAMHIGYCSSYTASAWTLTAATQPTANATFTTLSIGGGIKPQIIALTATTVANDYFQGCYVTCNNNLLQLPSGVATNTWFIVRGGGNITATNGTFYVAGQLYTVNTSVPLSGRCLIATFDGGTWMVG